MSARARIVGWMLLLVGLALAVAVVATWLVLLVRLTDQVNAELANEAAELRNYAASARDPDTGGRPDDVAQLFDSFMAINVPDRDEVFLAVIDGEIHRQSPPENDGLGVDAALLRAVAGRETPFRGELDSPAGQVRYAVVPVRVEGDERAGAWVVAILHERQQREVDEVIRVLGITAFGALLLATVAGWLVAGRVLAPIRMVRRTADQIGDSADLSRRLDVTGDDDVAELARTFNRMLDRLEAAFAAQRQFADDAGHELRTPITVVRGHLELMGDDPAERAQTVALVTEELDRMSRIVADLLVLARAGHPDFLNLGDVELADLTVSVAAKARALGDRTWRVAEIAEGHIRADEQRLTQALMQFASNAVAHTGPGDRIEFGSALMDGKAVLWVRDSGPGVPEADRERIFERFVRAGEHRHEGTGLGLAIVRSIARAHGGDTHVEAPPDGGACFVLALPGPDADGGGRPPAPEETP
ncbi:sensor histidine kinase [Allonocardiopsis opalescens]|uniref:histidine kinase n=1 Tax=Allonocardiopsis opalescens TaxID=1144618 RepID=A0A2T0PX91_9ACTN|nr:HAMP domain-containing sensor histidine kinase [Allonocardiopsis opalescens]PRX96160.1 signal transduction histidine kinase [Allonocardiopsis opalescens]